MKPARFAFTLGVVSLALAGCSGADDKQPEPTAKKDCDFKLSDYPGDCQALQAPADGKGFQLHFGPTNYDDKADVERFLLQPQKEVNVCLHMTSPNTEKMYFNEYHGTVRGGSHHMIVFGAPSDENGNPPAGTPADGTLEPCQAYPGLQYHFIVGAQNGIGPEGGRIDFPTPGMPIAPENQGLAYSITPKTHIAYQVHYINTSKDKPLLMESWANFISVPESEVKSGAQPLWWIGGLKMTAPANSNVTAKNVCYNIAQAPRRIIGMTAHAHAHMTRFSAYKVPAGPGDANLITPNPDSLVYQEFNWAEAEIFYYDTLTKNPKTDLTKRISGASSGLLELQPGEGIYWECEVHNNETYDLTFGNEAYNSEMCNIFGAGTALDKDVWACYGG